MSNIDRLPDVGLKCLLNKDLGLLVDQTRASWNQVSSWLGKLVTLRSCCG